MGFLTVGFATPMVWQGGASFSTLNLGTAVKRHVWPRGNRKVSRNGFAATISIAGCFPKTHMSFVIKSDESTKMPVQRRQRQPNLPAAGGICGLTATTLDFIGWAEDKRERFIAYVKFRRYKKWQDWG